MNYHLYFDTNIKNTIRLNSLSCKMPKNYGDKAYWHCIKHNQNQKKKRDNIDFNKYLHVICNVSSYLKPPEIPTDIMNFIASCYKPIFSFKCIACKYLNTNITFSLAYDSGMKITNLQRTLNSIP